MPSDSSSPSPVIAAVDVGTNSIKMTVASRGPDHNLITLETASETVRLGEGVAASGLLAPDRIEAALDTLTRFADTARSHGAAHLIGVATEATRRAANGEAFLAQVREQTGWNLMVISGEDEAALTFRGLAQGQDLSGRIVAADIGGGSTELILAIDGRIERSESIPLGSGTSTDAFMHSDPPTQDEISAVSASAESLLVPLVNDLKSPQCLMLLGGTAEHLGRLAPDPDRIVRADISRAIKRVTRESSTDLAASLGIPESRARVLPAGIAIIAALVKLLGPRQIRVAQSGIRTGLILATLDEIDAAAGTRRAPAAPMSPRAVMRTKIAECWDDVWAAMPAAIAGDDPEGVHDVRVASRRLRAAMAAAAGYFPKKWYDRLHETARTITKDLGAVRDRDVLLDALAKSQKGRLSEPERRALSQVISRLRSERAAAREALLSFVDELETRDIPAETRLRFAKSPAAHGPARKQTRKSAKDKARKRRGRDLHRQLAADARRVLKSRIAGLYRLADAIDDPEAVRKQHRTRIAAKRLRYTLELFADQFGARGQQAIDEMKDLQEQLGLIHDIDLRTAMIDDEIAQIGAADGADPDLMIGLQGLRSRQLRLRDMRHAEVRQQWHALDQAGFRETLRGLTRKPGNH